MGSMSQRPLSFGFSPCPNDTFAFHALVHGQVAPGITVRPRLEDVETLNQAALHGELDLVKVSYHAFGLLGGRYRMLPAGGALGRGVGPLVVTRERLPDLAGRRVAIPGGTTTARLLLELALPEGARTEALRYDRILPAVAAGDVDAGLIIHESRFTYPAYGLREHLDLGAWWEAETGLPLPLGGIAARRELGEATSARLAEALRDSVRHAWAHPDASRAYVAGHAQEMDETVRRRHVELYVNDYTLDVGAEGRAAAFELLRRAHARGLVPEPQTDPFVAIPAA